MTVTIPGGLFRTFSRLSASAWLASWGWQASTQPGHGWHTDESDGETRFMLHFQGTQNVTIASSFPGQSGLSFTSV